MSEGSAATMAAVSFRPVRKLCLVCGLLVGALLVIALIAFAAFPPVYEARCKFAMYPFGHEPRNVADVPMLYSDNYEEIYNTRLGDWRSDKAVAKIVCQYRTTCPASTVSDQVLIDTIGRGSWIERIEHSRTMRIIVWSTSPQLAATLANLYADAIKSHTEEENKDRCEHAVAEITERVKKQCLYDEDIAKRLQKFRNEHKDGMNVADEACLKQLEKEREVSAMMLKDLKQREKDARTLAEQSYEIVDVVHRAEVPAQPVNFISKVFYHLTGGRCYEK